MPKLSYDQLHLAVPINRVKLVVQSLKFSNIFSMKLCNLLNARVGHLLNSDRSPYYHSQGLPMGHNTKVVLEDTSAKEQNWGKSNNVLKIVLDSPDHGAFTVWNLVIDKGFSKSKCWNQVHPVSKSQFNESFPPFDD